jgi:hypothetical protein
MRGHDLDAVRLHHADDGTQQGIVAAPQPDHGARQAGEDPPRPPDREQARPALDMAGHDDAADAFAAEAGEQRAEILDRDGETVGAGIAGLVGLADDGGDQRVVPAEAQRAHDGRRQGPASGYDGDAVPPRRIGAGARITVRHRPRLRSGRRAPAP